MTYSARIATIVAGGLLALSFLLPWISAMLVTMTPIQMLWDAHHFGMPFDSRILIFVGTFVLGGVAAVRAAMGKYDPRLTLAAGAAPILVVLYVAIRSGANSADLRTLLRSGTVGIGAYVHYLSALALIGIGGKDFYGARRGHGEDEPVDVAD